MTVHRSKKMCKTEAPWRAKSKKITYFNKICGGLWRIVGNFLYFCSEVSKDYVHMRFLGNIEAKTDAKGRVFLPATFRKELQAAGVETLVMRKDVHQRCLVLYPESVWNERMDALLSRVSEWDDVGQQVLRQYVSEAEVLTLDGNGRFLIPRRYLQMADIDQTVRFIGMNNVIEIWAVEKTAQPFLSQEEFAARLKSIMTKSPHDSDD